MKLSPAMLRLLYEAVEAGGHIITQGPEVLTARALRRRGLVSNGGPAPSGRGWCWLINAAGRAALAPMDPEANDPPDPKP